MDLVIIEITFVDEEELWKVTDSSGDFEPFSNYDFLEIFDQACSWAVWHEVQLHETKIIRNF